ncbi:MAG: alpha/beta hydrolase [Ferruginibacter sp.]
MKPQNLVSTQSKQIQEISNWWRKASKVQTEMTSLEEIRDFNENWAGLSAEPMQVDYIETSADGVPAMWMIPKGCDESKLLLCFHGGGFFCASMYSHRKLFAQMAKQIGCKALTINYRQAPEHPHPAQVDDAVTAYEWLLKQGIKARNIVLTGDSSGGGLAITTLVKARDKGLPMPAATLPFSAWFDMELSGDSMEANRGRDHAFTKELINGLVTMVLGENGNKKDPYVNPLYADLKGLPPIYMQVGSEEVLLDDSTRLKELAQRAGVEVKLDIVDDMQHTFLMAVGRAPEANDAITRYVNWIKPKLKIK